MTKNELTRYSDDDLKLFEGVVKEKLQIARNQLEYYLKLIQEFGQSDAAKVRGLDNSNSTVEQERMFTLAGRQRKLIQHLENANSRIQNKAYGICRETGNLISKERLLVVPHATLSIVAKQKS